MIVSMQGNWTVAFKSKSSTYPQQFVVQGATSGDGIYDGILGSVAHVIGTQWSIIIQHDPGTGMQSSDVKLQFPHITGGNYEFDIRSNDSFNDQDFNDLVLKCSTSRTTNDFIIFGNVTLYSDTCYFNPCRRRPYVIDTYSGLVHALKNSTLRKWLEKYYPERVRSVFDDPYPPDPRSNFKPIVFDLEREAAQPKTTLTYSRKPTGKAQPDAETDKETESKYVMADFNLVNAKNTPTERLNGLSTENISMINTIEPFLVPCITSPASNISLSFEEYDRSAAELAGGVYAGNGNRRLLGDAITDRNGNYIFRFTFDMTFPGLEDSLDIIPGEDVNVVMYPDVIVKIIEYSPYEVRYESAPFNNIGNLRRINLCLPESVVHIPSVCFNGNLIGSLGDVFIGGNQNTQGTISATALHRAGYSNCLGSDGIVTVRNPLALFSVDCAAWYKTIDIKGCMYDHAKTPAQNLIKWYTIRIKRASTATWSYVSENYKHPRFSNRNLPNYIGDDVGPFYPNLGGTLNGTVPSYINIQREINVDLNDWELANSDRYMQLNTNLYDAIAGIKTPGTFHLRVDGYDSSGLHVHNATDLIAIYIHNNGLKFDFIAPDLAYDPAIIHSDCNLHRLPASSLHVPMNLSFRASDPYGFVDNYLLSMHRCPGTALDLHANIEENLVLPTNPAYNPGNFNLVGSHYFPRYHVPADVNHNHTAETLVLHGCSDKGTETEFTNPGLINVEIFPYLAEGWIKTSEYYTVYSFYLTANQRVTNGYNTGVSGTYYASGQIMMERV